MGPAAHDPAAVSELAGSVKLRRKSSRRRDVCTPMSPHYPRHRFTSRHRTQLSDGTWTDWVVTCCWCGTEAA